MTQELFPRYPEWLKDKTEREIAAEEDLERQITEDFKNRPIQRDDYFYPPFVD